MCLPAEEWLKEQLLNVIQKSKEQWSLLLKKQPQLVKIKIQDTGFRITRDR